jgi:hypothetical protein
LSKKAACVLESFVKRYSLIRTKVVEGVEDRIRALLACGRAPDYPHRALLLRKLRCDPTADGRLTRAADAMLLK